MLLMMPPETLILPNEIKQLLFPVVPEMMGSILEAAFKAIPYLTHLRDHEWHFVMGPRMEECYREQFMATAREVSGRFPNVPAYINHVQMAELPKELTRSAFSLSLAGYNTLLEVAAAGVPALLVPKFANHEGRIEGMDAEQWDRLQRLRDRDMASIAHPEQVLQPELFASLIDAAYLKGPTRVPVNMDGASNTASIINHMLAERRAGMAEAPQVVEASRVRFLQSTTPVVGTYALC